MYNRHMHERQQLVLAKKIDEDNQNRKLDQKKRKQRQQNTQHYKSRVRDFLVQMAKHPLELGKYMPPIKTVLRDIDEEKNIAHSQLFINGYKTGRQRSQRAIADNNILDCTPSKSSVLNYQFRTRIFERQIQPSFKFKNSTPHTSLPINSSRSVAKLPAIYPNPEKLHFKAIQEMSNKLPSMQLKEKQKIGLVNKLQTVYGGREIVLQKTSLQILKSCGLTKSKTVKTLRPRNFISSESTENLC